MKKLNMNRTKLDTNALKSVSGGAADTCVGLVVEVYNQKCGDRLFSARDRRAKFVHGARKV